MIDFIVDLFSFEHPGLSYAIDPLTAAMLLKAGSQAVSSVSNTITGRKDEKEAEERLKELGAEEEALKKKRTYGIADTFNKYLAASRQDKASDLLRQQEKERFATNVGALSGGGAKALLGGLAAQSRQSAMQQAQIEAGAQERQLDALKQYAAVEQAAANRNVGLAASDLARTQGLLDDQEAARIAARASKRQGITDTLQTGLNIAGDFADKEAESLTVKHGAKVYAQNGGSGLGSLASEQAQLKALAAELAQDKEEDTSEEKAPRLTASEAVARVRSKNLNEAAIEDIDQDDDAGEEKVPRLTASEKKALRRDRRFEDKEERYTARRKRLKKDRELAPNVFERRQRLLDAIKGREQMALSQRQLEMLNKSNLTAQERQALIDRVIAGQGEEEEAEVPDTAPNRASTSGTTGAAQRIVRVGGMGVPGLKIPGLKHGGVKKTPGEFSHSKNPIDIMKDGAKIGEMTGGEYIFNPRQASTLQSLASKGGSPLHKYVRNLLKEFDKR